MCDDFEKLVQFRIVRGEFLLFSQGERNYRDIDVFVFWFISLGMKLYIFVLCFVHCLKFWTSYLLQFLTRVYRMHPPLTLHRHPMCAEVSFFFLLLFLSFWLLRYDELAGMKWFLKCHRRL